MRCRLKDQIRFPQLRWIRPTSRWVPVSQPGATGRPLDPIADMGRRADQPVRTEQSLLGCATPDDDFAEKLPAGKLRERCLRGRDHAPVAHDDGCRRAHDDVRAILAVQPVDPPVFPDLFCDPEDIVREIPELRIEAFHGS